MPSSNSFRAGTPSSDQAGLQRGLTTTSALGVNIIDIVGVGPFVTLPLIVTTMGGPQAMFSWLLGALLLLCDGLIWSELGTAYPEAGGSYVYPKHLYGGQALGRAISFLYVWQLLFSAPLSIASGCIGFSQYLSYFLPHSGQTLFSVTLLHISFILSQLSPSSIAKFIPSNVSSNLSASSLCLHSCGSSSPVSRTSMPTRPSTFRPAPSP